MTGANFSVRGQPHIKSPFDNRAPALEPPASSVQPRTSSKAKKKLIATHPNSKFELTNWNQRHLTISNRNKNPHSYRQILSVSLHPEWNRRARLFTLSASEGRGQSAPVWEDGSSIRPQASSLQNPITNLRLEFPVSPSRQTMAPHSNREEFRAPLDSDFKLCELALSLPNGPRTPRPSPFWRPKFSPIRFALISCILTATRAIFPPAKAVPEHTSWNELSTSSHNATHYLAPSSYRTPTERRAAGE
jgi:hypothetical protein